MKIPERIYLQYYCEDDFGDLVEAYEITWCQDQINDSDIEYVLASKVSEQQEQKQ